MKAIKRLIGNLVRAWEYAKIGYGSYDWDYNSLYHLLHFKLDRMHCEMKQFHDEHLIEDNIPVKSIRVAARLAGRLKEERYEDALLDRHDAKWGELQVRFEESGEGSKMVTWRDKANTKRKISQEKKEYKAAIEQAHKWRARDLATLCRILVQYDRRWWT